MRLYLDDKRLKPDDFDIQVFTAQDAITILKTGKITHISLDHDLGDETLVGNGHQVSDWIEEAAFYNTIPPLTWSIHSSNGPEIARMTITLKNAERYWSVRP